MRIRLAVSGSFALLALLTAAGRSQAQGAPKPVTLLNVSYDPTRELYEDFNKQFATLLEGQDRPGRDHPPVARRVGQAGPLGDRRAGGRCGHARARLRHRPDLGEGRAPPGQLAVAAAEQQRALHLDDRAARPQGKSQGDQGLGRSGQAGRLGHHAQPQDLRWCSLELPGGLGLGAAAAGRQRGHGQGVRGQAVQERSGARRRRPRVHHDLRGARHRRRADRVGERGAAGDQGAGSGQVRGGRAHAQHPGRAAGSRGRQGGGQARDEGGGAGVSGIPVHARGAGDRGQELLPAPRIPPSPPSMPRSSRRSVW